MCDNAAKTLGSNHLKHIAEANEKPVGASLLAMKECQLALMLSDTPQSRASPLPQARCFLWISFWF
jgi:hypothetical protein